MLTAVSAASCSPAAVLSVRNDPAPCSTAVSLLSPNCFTEFYITVSSQVHAQDVRAALKGAL